MQPSLLFGYKLYHHHVHLAMKRHLYGAPHGIPLSSLRFTEFEPVRFPDYPPYSTMLSTDARIVSNDLLLRIQHWILLPTRDHTSFPHGSLANFCPHLSSSNPRSKLYSNIAHVLAHLGDPTLALYADTCSFCAADFELRASDFGPKGNAFIATRWLNLGAGLSPTDPKWTRHIMYWVSSPEEPPGSVRQAFEAAEGSEGLSVQLLTEQNAVKFFAEKDAPSNASSWRERSSEDWVIEWPEEGE